jgi:thiol-disulfide isomerase/thioredoxin
MSRRAMALLAAGAIALIAIVGVGILATGNRVDDNAAVPGDEASAAAAAEERVSSADEPAEQPAGGGAEPLPKGPDLPSLTGTDLATGEVVSLTEAVDGRPVVIQMWASWCHVCDETADEVKRFVEERPDISYLGVDVQDDEGSGRGFVSEHGWTHRSIFDDGQIAQTFGLRGTPTYIFVHADGKIAGQTIGDPGYEGLNRIADRLIASS